MKTKQDSLDEILKKGDSDLKQSFLYFNQFNALWFKRYNTLDNNYQDKLERYIRMKANHYKKKNV